MTAPSTDAEQTWVCDTCMLRVHRDQIAVWADGEHVVCQWCRRDEAEVEALRATVARVEAMAGFLAPDHITPMGERLLKEAIEGEA